MPPLTAESARAPAYATTQDGMGDRAAPKRLYSETLPVETARSRTAATDKKIVVIPHTCLGITMFDPSTDAVKSSAHNHFCKNFRNRLG
jgi:hypothetical protein